MANVQDIIKSSGFITQCKQILKQDCLEQLEGNYGLLQLGNFEDISMLPNLTPGSHDLAVRQQLEKFITNHIASGLDGFQAVNLLIKEYAFTYLNRFIALKMMEERKIILQSFSRGYDSKNYKFWLPEHPEQEKLWRQGKVFLTYKNFLTDLFLKLSADEEIKLLFNPDSVYSILFPREQSIRSLFDILNSESISEIWKEDETIGWVYQYFIEDEKSLVFDKIYQQKKKLDLRDIPAATQIFTPKWIVKWIVENTLGRLWLRMHPDSALLSQMAYFVPNDQDKSLIPVKPVSEITLLDPACGTMHFGMYGFDLFYEMYQEEISNAGKAGWPQTASVSSVDDIPRSIIENNLYGIDIDLRAIQLSALSLYLKAKSKNKNIVLSKYNLACTDIPPFTEEAIKSFIDDLSVGHAITKKLLLQVLPLLNKAYYLGSLLKIEEVVDSFVEKEKLSLKSSFQLDLFSAKSVAVQKELDLFVEKKIIWEDVRKEIRAALIKFSEINKDQLGGFLAGESVKGLNLIDALIRKHDILVSNPPYSGRRNWPKNLKKELSNIYGKRSGDLYTCFIDRSIDAVLDNGFIGMVTIHSFMFTSSHEEIRKRIFKETSIESFVHLGTKTEFEVANKTAQGFVMFSLNKVQFLQNTSCGIFFRMVYEDEANKHVAFLKCLSNINSDLKKTSPQCFKLAQEKFHIIPGWPIVYWITESIRDLFKNPLYSSKAEARQGMTTLDNKRFVRFTWEQKFEYNNSFLWKLYSKGGEVNRWYGNLYYCVKWDEDSVAVYKTSTNRSIILSRKSVDYLDKEAIGYTFLTVSNFSCRYFPGGAFDIGGSCMFATSINLYFLMSILNSKLATFLLKLINPTVNQQVGDIEKLPLPLANDTSLEEELIKNAKKCISLKKFAFDSREISWEYHCPIAWDNGIYTLLFNEKDITIMESYNSKSIYSLYNISQNNIRIIENEVGKIATDMVLTDVLTIDDETRIKSLYLDKHIPSSLIASDLEFVDDENNEESDSEEEESKNKGKQSRFLLFDEICLASGFHPDTVYNYIVSNKLERPEERYELAVRWVSYAIGVVMGRFIVDGISPDDDGICALDEGHSDDFPKLIFDVLVKVLGEQSAIEVVATINEGLTDKPHSVLRKFLEKDFFTKWHIPMYKKRPIYWLLQSKKRNYGLYIYNQNFTNEALYAIIQKYINSKLKLEKTKSEELIAKKATTNNPTEKRKIDSEISKIEDLILEVEQFKKDVQEVIDSGFIPDIDDGVILNMAPLHKLIPSWKEPEKFYKKLKEGDFEWSSVSQTLFQ